MIGKATEKARDAKHQLWLQKESLLGFAKSGRDRGYKFQTRHGLPEFDPAKHTRQDGTFPLDYFLNRVPEEATKTLPTPKRLFTAWTGTNPMSADRSRALASIREAHSGIEHIHITPENLDEWVVDSHPLHPSYQLLSEIHRSDYLRAYLLHHHGGGWSDVKHTSTDWTPFYERFSDDNLWILGSPEISSTHPAYIESEVGSELRKYFSHLIANCAFIARPQSPFTKAWLEEVESRLDYYHRSLKRHPAQDPFGLTGSYPIPWSQIMGEVFQPLQLRYPNHIGLEPSMRADSVSFR